MKFLLGKFGFTMLVITFAGGVAWTADAVSRPQEERGYEDEVMTLAQGKLIDTSEKFSHTTHLGKKAAEKNDGKKLDCSSCHTTAAAAGKCPKAEVTFPKHEACTKCHAANFYTPPLTICGSCHTSNAFKKGNPLKDTTRQSAPLKSAFNHKTHLIAKGKARRKTGKKLDCTSCHKIKKGGKRVTQPGHANCCQCHTDTKLAVNMTKCSSCHNTSKAVRRRPSMIHSFTHAKHHRTSKEGTSLACRTCHTNGHKATTIRAIKVPPMASCVGCHDGEYAWHFSDCLKCHKEGAAIGSPPPSHPK